MVYEQWRSLLVKMSVISQEQLQPLLTLVSLGNVTQIGLFLFCVASQNVGSAKANGREPKTYLG